MDEAVLRAVFRRDEAEALAVVEPLHGSDGTHSELLWVLMTAEGAVSPYTPTVFVLRQYRPPHWGIGKPDQR
jgi:hypothetical protein